MAKKSKKCSAVEVAPERSPETVNLYGKDVIKNAKVDQKVKLYITGKIVEIGRERYNENRLHQRIDILSVKQVASSVDLDDKVSRKVNDA